MWAACGLSLVLVVWRGRYIRLLYWAIVLAGRCWWFGGKKTAGRPPNEKRKRNEWAVALSAGGGASREAATQDHRHTKHKSARRECYAKPRCGMAHSSEAPHAAQAEVPAARSKKKCKKEEVSGAFHPAVSEQELWKIWGSLRIHTPRLIP